MGPPNVTQGVAVDDPPPGSEAAVVVPVADGTNATVAIPVGPYADLGVATVQHAITPVTSLPTSVGDPLLTSNVRSDMWRDQGDAEERKIRFLASQPEHVRRRLWWRKTALGKYCGSEDAPCRPRCSCYCNVYLFFAILFFIPVYFDYAVAAKVTKCGDGEISRFSFRRSRNTYVGHPYHTYLVEYEVNDAESGELMLQIVAHNHSVMHVRASAAAVRRYSFPPTMKLPLMYWSGGLYIAGWRGELGSSTLTIHPVRRAERVQRSYGQVGQAAEVQSKDGGSNDRSGSIGAGGGGGGSGGSHGTFEPVIDKQKRMYLSAWDGRTLVSTERFAPGRIFYMQSAPTAALPEGAWMPVGEAASSFFRQPLRYDVCTALPSKMMLSLLLTLAASDRMLDNNGVVSDTFGRQGIMMNSAGVSGGLDNSYYDRSSIYTSGDNGGWDR